MACQPLPAGYGTYDEERLLTRGDVVGQWRIRRFMRYGYIWSVGYSEQGKDQPYAE